MAYKTNSAPYVRAKKSTLQVMIELGIALAIIWLAAITTTFVKLGSAYGIKSIFLMVVALVTTAACDAISTVLQNKKDKTLGKKILHDLVYNYSWITAMIFTLICPVWTNYYVIVVGSIFATVIGKLVFGGFGKNIFNPAAMGRIFVGLCFNLSAPAGLQSGVDTTTGATITGIFNSTQGWLGSNPIPGFDVSDILLGTYFGAMGETFTVLILILGIILAIRGVINWRAPAFYLGTTFISALLIALVCGFNNPFLYVLYHLGLGGLMFGAIFMLTDPVTTPTSPVGNCFIGILAALLTVLIRVGTGQTEGVVYSIVVVNLLSPTIDQLVTAKTNKKLGLKAGVTFGMSAVTIIACTLMGWSKNGGREVYDINGIDINEYNRLVAQLNLTDVTENGYTYAPYSKETPASDRLVEVVVENEDGTQTKLSDKAYSLFKDGKETGVVYCIKTKKEIHIETNPGYSQTKSCTAYVAINTADMTLIDFKYVVAPGTNSDYKGLATNGVDKFDFTGKTNADMQNVTGHDISSGASYSGEGAKIAINYAFEIANAEFAK